jgi:hypothetical protein
MKRHRSIALVALAACAAPMAGVASASAMEPTGDYAVFTQCPRYSAGVNLCLFARTSTGKVTLGDQTVPITNPIVLQRGIVRNEGTEAETFVAALNGDTLTKSPQSVPRGLLDLLECSEITEPLEHILCELAFENGITAVNATTELAKPASAIRVSKNNLVNREGVALSLPVKIHLESPLLGSDCYIGSSSQPLVWNLTTGTTSPPAPNGSISGKVGKIDEKDKAEFIQISNNTLVDNAFASPGVTGCGGALAFVLDPIINSKLGLPAPAGHGTVILNNLIDLAAAESVIASAK